MSTRTVRWAPRLFVFGLDAAYGYVVYRLIAEQQPGDDRQLVGALMTILFWLLMIINRFIMSLDLEEEIREECRQEKVTWEQETVRQRRSERSAMALLLGLIGLLCSLLVGLARRPRPPS